LKLPRFTGNGNQDPEEWWKEFEKVVIVNQWPQERAREKLCAYLGEDAEEWYDDTYVMVEGQYPTLAALKESFKEKFCNQRWKNKWKSQLEKLRQQDEEAVGSYYSRFKKLIKRVTGLTEEQKMFYFTRGLKGGLLPIVSLHNFDDVADLVELVQKYEAAKDFEEELEPGEEMKYKRRMSKKKKKKVMFEEESSSEEEVQTPAKRNKKKEEIKEDPVDQLTKQLAELKIQLTRVEKGDKPRNSNIECYHCGKKGHIAKNCFSKRNENNYRNNNNNNFGNNNFRNNNYPNNSNTNRSNQQENNNYQNRNGNNHGNQYNRNQYQNNKERKIRIIIETNIIIIIIPPLIL
jgi:hypothetical protein